MGLLKWMFCRCDLPKGEPGKRARCPKCGHLYEYRYSVDMVDSGYSWEPING